MPLLLIWDCNNVWHSQYSILGIKNQCFISQFYKNTIWRALGYITSRLGCASPSTKRTPCRNRTKKRIKSIIKSRAEKAVHGVGWEVRGAVASLPWCLVATGALKAAFAKCKGLLYRLLLLFPQMQAFAGAL